MLFLIEYDRKSGKIVQINRFSDSNKDKANEVRLDLEIKTNREKIDREIVLLEALDENTLRTTHGRYFKELSDFEASVLVNSVL